MKINLWAKLGKAVPISIIKDSSPNTAPTVTIEIKDPQILYDDISGKITIVESK